VYCRDHSFVFDCSKGTYLVNFQSAEEAGQNHAASYDRNTRVTIYTGNPNIRPLSTLRYPVRLKEKHEKKPLGRPSGYYNSAE